MQSKISTLPVDTGIAPPDPSGRKSYRGVRARLQTVQDVQWELAKLYREARAGKLDVGDASKLGHLLALIARIMTDTDLEARITALEGQEAR